MNPTPKTPTQGATVGAIITLLLAIAGAMLAPTQLAALLNNADVICAEYQNQRDTP